LFRKLCKQLYRKTGNFGGYKVGWSCVTCNCNEKCEENNCLENDICRNYAIEYYGIECLDEYQVNFNDRKCVRKKWKLFIFGEI
jgi:hypothetical protein